MTKNLTQTEKLAFSTVRIESVFENGSRGTGTGFFYGFSREPGGSPCPFIVTNKHVIESATELRFVLTKANQSGDPVHCDFYRLALKSHEVGVQFHPSEEVDLCAIAITQNLQQAGREGIKFFFTLLDGSLLPTEADLSEFSAVEDVLMVGYPNGIWDDINNQPIIRRGITATHPAIDFKGRREFLIDCACFPGSSGSPVFLYNVGIRQTRNGSQSIGGVMLKLLGILYAGHTHSATGEIRVETIPTNVTHVPVPVTGIPNNLGVVIKSEHLKELESAIRIAISGQL